MSQPYYYDPPSSSSGQPGLEVAQAELISPAPKWAAKHSSDFGAHAHAHAHEGPLPQVVGPEDYSQLPQAVQSPRAYTPPQKYESATEVPMPPRGRRGGACARKPLWIVAVILLVVLVAVAVAVPVAIAEARKTASSTKHAAAAEQEEASSQAVKASQTPQATPSVVVPAPTSATSRGAASATEAELVITASPTATSATCSWVGHCLGDPCVDFNDCANDYTCSNSQCVTYQYGTSDDITYTSSATASALASK